jgi:hypothetical protein
MTTPVFRRIYPREVSYLGKLRKEFRKRAKIGIRLRAKNIFLFSKNADARAEPKNKYPQYGNGGKREFLKEK